MTSYKLYYFNITGLGEPIRYLMNYFGIEFEDFRIERADWPTYKAEMPLGQMPVLEIDGKKYNQCKCLCRYLAKQGNLAGDDDLEALQIDMTADNIDDMRVAVITFVQQQDPDIKEKMKEPALTKMKFILEKLEEQVQENGGYFVGGKLSWVDIFYVAASEVMPFMVGYDINNDHPNLQQLVETVRNLPNIKEYIENRPKTEF